MQPPARPVVLVVDDDPSLLRSLSRVLRADYEVIACASGAEALAALESRTVAVLITDHFMDEMSGLALLKEVARRHPDSAMRRVVVTGRADVRLLEGYLNEGQIDHFLQKPFAPEELRRLVADSVEAHTAEVARRRAAAALREKNASLADENRALRERLQSTPWFERLIGTSPALRAAIHRADQVRRTDVTVHVHGETGTGKELVARALHEGGPRADKPFIAQNCAGLNGALLQSTLFGYVKGAFTGAERDREGVLQKADGGTLFLDEVAELPPTAQATLLRVLQDGCVVPVGATQGETVDVRLISATHVDLKARVAEGRFREDLYYRLVVLQIDLPPLRARAGDIGLLAAHFHALHAEKYGKASPGLSRRLLERLEAYAWPGNVRELANEIERMVVISDAAKEIDVDLLSPHISAGAPAAVNGEDGFFIPYGMSYDEARDRVARALVSRALEESGGVVRVAAEALAMDRSRLAKLRRRLGLHVAGRSANAPS